MFLRIADGRGGKLWSFLSSIPPGDLVSFSSPPPPPTPGVPCLALQAPFPDKAGVQTLRNWSASGVKRKLDFSRFYHVCLSSATVVELSQLLAFLEMLTLECKTTPEFQFRKKWRLGFGWICHAKFSTSLSVGFHCIEVCYFEVQLHSQHPTFLMCELEHPRGLYFVTFSA